MKRIICALPFFISSCSNYIDTDSVIVVTRIEQNYKNVISYDIGDNSFPCTFRTTIYDTINKYSVGDTIILIKKP